VQIPAGKKVSVNVFYRLARVWAGVKDEAKTPRSSLCPEAGHQPHDRPQCFRIGRQFNDIGVVAPGHN
jgi:hypothetical protein